ncbi:MAG: M20/M25/M40 family metallo-hydrolase [Blastocatellia bacterium]
MPSIRRAASCGLLMAVLACPAFTAPNGLNWERIQLEAIELFVQYLRIETANPPGNEIRAARFFAEICRREGIEHQVFEPSPGRGTIWARIRGDGSRRPIILLNHLDVVPNNREFWTVDPFGGVIRDGFIYGRGALDMKSLGMAEFMTLLTLKRARVKLTRDVIFLGTADEEAGGLEGAGWFVRNHPALLDKAEFLLNEGGGNLIDPEGKVLAVGVGPSEKTPAWLRLTANGTAGHASLPRPDSAVTRLIRALNRLLDYAPPIKLTPVVEESFRSSAALRAAPAREKFLRIRESIQDPDFLRALEADPAQKALLHNTISVTVLQGSNKINIIPPSAHADIDTRLVPGERLDAWIAELKSVIRDDSIRIEPILAFNANASPVDTALVRAVGEIVRDRYPGAVISYPVQAGFTDCHYFRDLGIHSYGFSPFLAAPRELGTGVHGNDERIGLKAFAEGVRFFYEVVERTAR